MEHVVVNYRRRLGSLRNKLLKKKWLTYKNEQYLNSLIEDIVNEKRVIEVYEEKQTVYL